MITLQNSLGQVSVYKGLRSADRDVLWWPLTQRQRETDDKVTLIDSATGDLFQSGGLAIRWSRTDPMFDACASWWT
jgi:hypothetical protein